MDGTGITTSTMSFVVHTLAVDQSDGLLYVSGEGNSYRVGDSQSNLVPDNHIGYMGFNSDAYSNLISLVDLPEQIKPTDGYVFWSSWSTSKNTWSIFRCEQRSGNGFELLESKAITPLLDRIVNFDVIIQAPHHSNICGGGLCSHICIPTTAGYMRCACPVGFQLRSDGWTCGTLFNKVFELLRLVN